MNCLERPTTDGLPDFCGRCANCTRIAEADALEDRFAEAVEARENLREADKRETRLFVQTHPDVLIIPPDPPQMLVKVDQVRHVIHEIYYKPVEGRERVYIFSDADFMKEAANSLLKMLEEPPEFATIFLLSDNPSALLPTIRSRCMHLRLAPLSSAEVEQYLARHRPEWTPRERALVARVCGGGLGRARGFDLAGYLAARQDALTMLAPALRAGDHSDLFRVTDTYRSGAEGKAKTEHLIRTLYSLLEDMLFLKSGTAGAGAQSGHPGGAGAHGRRRGLCLDRGRRAAAGRSGERHAPQPAALVGAGQFRHCHSSAESRKVAPVMDCLGDSPVLGYR